MCAILDANVAHEVFTANQTEAGREFLRWLTKRQGRLAVGGKLRRDSRDTGPPKDGSSRASVRDESARQRMTTSTGWRKSL